MARNRSPKNSPRPEEQALNPEGPWVLLQGLGTPFLKTLSTELEQRGETVLRVNFCGGDLLFRGKEKSVSFAGAFSELDTFYARLILEFDIKGFVLFGDERPVHKPAIAAAKDAGRDVFVFEEGYLRPNFVTFERWGTNGNSTFVRTSGDLMRAAETLPAAQAGPALPNPMPARVAGDLLYKMGNILLAPKFPHYRTHRPLPMRVEAGGWIKRFLRRSEAKRARKRLLKHYDNETPAYFLIPLQLDSDTQIRVHSQFDGMPPFIDLILDNFSRHGPLDTRLLFKAHPLDNGVTDYRTLIHQKADNYNLADQVDFIDGGDLEAMITAARGVITVNSTVGLTALRNGCPTKALGKAIYRMEGLTDERDLADFWSQPMVPRVDLVDAMIRVLKDRHMIEGDLFTRKGIDIAARQAADILAKRRESAA